MVQELGAVVVDGQYVSGPVVMECSKDGLLVLEVDYNGGEVRVQLEPEILRTWSAELLAERIKRLHRLALDAGTGRKAGPRHGRERRGTAYHAGLAVTERRRRIPPHHRLLIVNQQGLVGCGPTVFAAFAWTWMNTR